MRLHTQARARARVTTRLPKEKRTTKTKKKKKKKREKREENNLTKAKKNGKKSKKKSRKEPANGGVSFSGIFECLRASDQGSFGRRFYARDVLRRLKAAYTKR